MERLLQAIERAGNRLPPPALLFMWLGLAVIALSWLCGLMGLAATHPVTGAEVAVTNLASADGLRRILKETVTNFTSFAPLGTVLVAMLGIGLAERSGLLASLLRRMVSAVPAAALCPVVVLAGILSSLAADTGYVVLIPLAAMTFHSAGRPPLAGIAAAFAGVSAGYSANLVIGPLDVILAGLSTEAVQLVYPDMQVLPTDNWYFIIASTVWLTIIATWVTQRITEARMPPPAGSASTISTPAQSHTTGMRRAGWCSLAMLLLILWATVPQQGILRDATGGMAQSPLLSGMVVVMALWAALCGLLYGHAAGTFSNGKDVVAAMEGSMKDMATYLVLMFFAAQFVAWFGWTGLGVVLAIKGAELLQAMDPANIVLLTAFILTAAAINLFVGSASAKWALIAPVFVPMLALTGISPQAAQMAYRIGDSTTNIITPLMPYFAMVLAFAGRYQPGIGIGTLIAIMLPYSIAFLAAWMLLFAAWTFAGLPLGPTVA